MNHRIGFMQGRLSDLVEGRIQAFPWSSWREEFAIAQQHGFNLMEWTLDQERLYESPLLTMMGQAEIKELCQRHGLRIVSLTGDCFMQAPFWKAQGEERASLQQDFHAVAEACAAVGISIIVVPLVDNGCLENAEQEDILVTFLESEASFLASHNLRVVFESDFGPAELARFISRFDSTIFGINYDIGNSAALGFDVAEEFSAYGNRIMNVHVKDRLLGGTTVPLETGHADFKKVFTFLTAVGYTGNYILQTARASDGDHTGVLCRYHTMVTDWLKRNAA
jgi:L-ribulose-5-phosphate 3-epimerase